MSRSLSIITILLSILLSLYFGVQGLILLKFQEEYTEVKARGENQDFSDTTKIVNYDGYIFPNQDEFELHLKKETLEKFTTWKSATGYPPYFLLIITSCSFSLLGAIVLIARRSLKADNKFSLKETYLYIILGTMAGIVVLAIADILPTLLVESEGSIRPVTLVFMSFFGGLYVDKFYEWADGRFNSIFKSDL